MELIEKVNQFILDMAASFQMVRLYSGAHAKFEASVDKIRQSLQEIFKERNEVIIGVIGDELAFEKEIFFELSRVALPLILNLKAREIEKIVFYPGVSKEELNKFIVFAANLNKDQVKRAPQIFLDEAGIKNISVGAVQPRAAASQGDKPAAENPAGTHMNAYEYFSSRFSEYQEALFNNETIDKMALKITMSGMVDNIADLYQGVMKLASIKRHDITTFMHIMNVSVLAMYFSAKLGFSKEEVSEIGTAALFHDTGKIYVSRRLIGKREALSDAEFASIKSHSQLGAALLLRYTESLGVLPVLVSFEHHMRYDLKGYPKVGVPYKLHVASLIVAICDVYDALAQRRSYKADYPSEVIYKIMMRERGAAFDSDLLDVFFRIIGVWPVGTLVSLSDGRIAVVRQENEDEIFKPKIEAVYPREKRETINLKDRKDIEIERSLNPFSEGKTYLHLI
jgi:HD-GYP domain-containing protein (c-di-GMP phosphodiesterase class II)